MPQPLRFSITHRCAKSAARVGRIDTPHGSFDTPAFMPVGTKATLKGLTPDHIRATGSQIILNNAYHLMLRPGDDSIARRGGVHRFMQWHGPILTDSGGYQAFSMSDINAVDDDGVTFASIIDGARIHLSPERSIEVQNNLGADIIMAFDDCPPAEQTSKRPNVKTSEGNDELCAVRSDEVVDTPRVVRRSSVQYDHVARLKQANERTIRWLERCVKAHRRPDEQALFGIVQGGVDEQMRRQSAETVTNIDLPGYAIGGVAVGESTELIHGVVRLTAPLLPESKPRYLMGVGYERDIVAAVKAGVDMFDCVLPTRNGRNGNAFTRKGRLHLRNAAHREDDAVIEQGCDCLACAGPPDGRESGGHRGGFSRAYIRHLFNSDEMLGPILVSLHNVRHFQRLMLDIRQAIREDGWSFFHRNWPVADPPTAGGGPTNRFGPNLDGPGIRAGMEERDN